MRYIFFVLSLICGLLQAQSTYTLDQGGNVSVSVWQDGYELKTLLKGEPKPPGTHPRPVWDGTDKFGNQVNGSVTFRFAVSNITGGPTGGVVGQYSPTIDNHIWRPLNNYMDVAVNPATGETYRVNYYAEGRSSVNKTVPGKPHSVFSTFETGTQQASQQIDFLNDTIYIAGEQSFREFNTYGAAIRADLTYNFEEWVNFGDTLIPSGNKFIPGFDLVTDTVPDVPGNSLVQQDVTGLVATANHIWTARMQHNAVHVFRKSDGKVVNRIPIDAPALCDIAQGRMWMLARDTAWLYNIVADSALSQTPTFIAGGDIRALDVSIDESRIAVLTVLADGANVVRIYDASTGAFEREILGGSYRNNVECEEGKVMFTQPKDSIRFSYVTWLTDSTLIVPDWGNAREHVVSDQGEVLFTTGGHIALYDVEQDPNDLQRLFLYFKEYRRDYDVDATKGAGKAWTLVRNWNTDPSLDSLAGELKRYITSPVTFSNGRTYCLLPNVVDGSLNYELVEADTLVGLRKTGWEGPTWSGENGGRELEIQADGNIYTSYRESDTVTLAYYELEGFDGNNPVYSQRKEWARFSRTEFDRIITVSTSSGEITSDSSWIVFWQTKTPGKFSLGAFQKGSNKPLWLAAQGVEKDGNDPSSRYEKNGDFTFDQRSNNSGSIVRVVKDVSGGSGDVIIYGDQGEFLFGRQANIYNVFTADGLFLYHLGIVAADADQYINHELMSGNNLGWAAAAHGNKVVLHGADENYKGGSMIIELSGLFDVRRFELSVDGPD